MRLTSEQRQVQRRAPLVVPLVQVEAVAIATKVVAPRRVKVGVSGARRGLGEQRSKDLDVPRIGSVVEGTVFDYFFFVFNKEERRACERDESRTKRDWKTTQCLMTDFDGRLLTADFPLLVFLSLSICLPPNICDVQGTY